MVPPRFLWPFLSSTLSSTLGVDTCVRLDIYQSRLNQKHTFTTFTCINFNTHHSLASTSVHINSFSRRDTSLSSSPHVIPPSRHQVFRHDLKPVSPPTSSHPLPATTKRHFLASLSRSVQVNPGRPTRTRCSPSGGSSSPPPKAHPPALAPRRLSSSARRCAPSPPLAAAASPHTPTPTTSTSPPPPPTAPPSPPPPPRPPTPPTRARAPAPRCASSRPGAGSRAAQRRR